MALGAAAHRAAAGPAGEAARVLTFVRSASHKKVADLPDLAHRHFDIGHWRHHAESSFRAYKKTLIDQGSLKPIIASMSTLFVFNYLFCLPREMAHNQHEEMERFKRA